MRRPLEDVVEAFPPAVDVVPTTGIQAGVILKYHWYYLKVYDRPHANYTVIGYCNRSQPLFVHEVDQKNLKRYGRQFSPTGIPMNIQYGTPTEMP